MSKTMKKGIIAAAVALCLAISCVLMKAPEKLPVFAETDGGGFTEVTVPNGGFDSAERGALEGWEFYMHDGANFFYHSDKMSMRATEDGHDGNGLRFIRTDAAAGEFVASGPYVGVEPNTAYNLSFWLKSTGTGSFKAGVVQANGDVEVGGGVQWLKTVEGANGGWEKYTVNFTTRMDAEKLRVRVSPGGAGEWTLDDVQIYKHVEMPAYQKDFSLWYKGTGFYDGANPQYEMLAETDISAESVDGDGASLLLADGMYYRIEFPKLPYNKVYTLSFSYKGGNGGANIRMDNYDLETDINHFYIGHSYNAAGELAANSFFGEYVDWKNEEFKFRTTNNAGTNKDIAYLEIHQITYSEGATPYIIDNIQITDEDGMQYLPQGSFAQNAYLNGYTLKDGAIPVEQPDGSYVFFGGSAKTPSRSFVTMDISTLEKGKEYTISGEVRGGFNQVAVVYFIDRNGAVVADKEIANVWAWCAEWTAFSGKFTPDYDIISVFFDSGVVYNSYIRNIRITDSDGREYLNYPTLNAAAYPDGENIYGKGSFDGDVNVAPANWKLAGGAALCGNAGGYVLQLTGAGRAESGEIAVKGDVVKISAENSGNAAITLLTDLGETVEEANGMYRLPAGTKTVKIVVSQESGYSVVDNVAMREAVAYAVSGEATLSLEDRVYINYYLDITACEGLSADGAVCAAVFWSAAENGEEIERLEMKLSEGRYKATGHGFAAKELGNTVFVQMVAEIGGAEYKTDVIEYGPKIYAQNKLADETSPSELKSLCLALLDYGAAAQAYFDYNVSAPANADVSEETRAAVNEWRGASWRTGKTYEREPFGGFSYAASLSLNLDEKVSLNGYVTAPNAEKAEMAVFAAKPDEAAIKERTGAEIVVMTETEGVFKGTSEKAFAAKELCDEVYIVFYVTTAEGKEETSAAVCYGPQIYAYNKLLSSDNAELKALCAAMVDYGAAAQKYFGYKTEDPANAAVSSLLK